MAAGRLVQVSRHLWLDPDEVAGVRDLGGSGHQQHGTYIILKGTSKELHVHEPFDHVINYLTGMDMWAIEDHKDIYHPSEKS